MNGDEVEHANADSEPPLELFESSVTKRDFLRLAIVDRGFDFQVRFGVGEDKKRINSEAFWCDLSSGVMETNGIETMF